MMCLRTTPTDCSSEQVQRCSGADAVDRGAGGGDLKKWCRKSVEFRTKQGARDYAADRAMDGRTICPIIAKASMSSWRGVDEVGRVAASTLIRIL